jgi:lysophospholipase L1-like esterase
MKRHWMTPNPNPRIALGSDSLDGVQNRKLWLLALALLAWLLLFSATGWARWTGFAAATGLDRQEVPAAAGSPAALRAGGGYTVTLPLAVNHHGSPGLYDSFSGSGPLAAHVPEVRPAGSFWAVRYGEFQDLAGGWARYEAGPYGTAIVDSTLSELELSGSLVVLEGLEYGLIVRSGSDGASRWLLTARYDGARRAGQVLLHRCPTLTGIDQTLPFEYGTPPALIPGTEYTFTLKCTGNAYRLWIDGAYAGAAHDTTSSYLDNTYVGLGTLDAASAMAWDRLVVQATPDRRVSIFGDSISVGTGKTWPYYVEATRHGVHANHAADSARIMPNEFFSDLPEQVAAATMDDTQIALFLIGTNDTLDPGIARVYRDALVDLSATNPSASLYVLGILERNPANWREEKNAYIAAGVAAAQALGVEVTYWSTDGWIDPATDTYDGLHPNAQGHAKIAAQVLARLP